MNILLKFIYILFYFFICINRIRNSYNQDTTSKNIITGKYDVKKLPIAKIYSKP